MPKQIIIAEQHRIAAIFSEDQIEEIIVATGTHQVGDVYMGTVENILTSIDAAFVNLGNGEKNGFIHISDLGPLRLRRIGTAISDLLSPHQKVLVQVMKEPTGNKGPRLTGNISLPGRYVVLIPFGRGVNLSRRILKDSERNRLRALGVLIKPSGMGLLVRTEAEGISEDLIMEDLDNLQRQWETVQLEFQAARSPSLLDREQDFVTRVLRDLFSSDVNRIVVDTADGFRRIRQQLQNWGDGKIPASLAIDHHQEPSSIMEYYRVNAAIREALRPRVDLPSGGYIIIEPTEAMTVVDVNSGSFTRSLTSRETVLWTNREASSEIARQLRLRNLAGVIIVDFIDMESREDQLQVLENFTRNLQGDKARPQIAQLTELGLVELTRKRQGQSLYEMFGSHCPHCSGLGILAHLPGEAMQEKPLLSLDDRALLESSDPFPDERERLLMGGTEQNIMNHPNYQERLPRRRRRPGREYPTPEVRSVPVPVPAVKVAPLEEVVDIVVAPEPIPERTPPRREVPRNRPEPPEPAEIVNVEMTAIEQEIYSFMGISPLVLVNRDAKESRNTIVRINLPGAGLSPILRQEPKEESKQQPELTEIGVPSKNGQITDLDQLDEDQLFFADQDQDFEQEEPGDNGNNNAHDLSTESEENGHDLEESTVRVIEASPAASRRKRTSAFLP